MFEVKEAAERFLVEQGASSKLHGSSSSSSFAVRPFISSFQPSQDQMSFMGTVSSLLSIGEATSRHQLA